MKMKPLIYGVILFASCAVGCFAGFRLSTVSLKSKISSGPWSDELLPAMNELRQAKAKIGKQDSQAKEHVINAEKHLQKIDEWMRIFPDRPSDN